MKKLAKFLLTTAATLVAAATVKAATVVGPISTVFYKDEGVTVSTSPNTIDFVGSGVTVTKTGVSSMTVTITGGGGGGASSLEVFNNNDATRSSPTASISLSDAFRGTVSGSTYTFRVNFSSVASRSDVILNRNSLQAGSTFYVSSGSVSGQLALGSIKWPDGTIQVSSPVITSPGGSNNQIQFNNSGSFDGGPYWDSSLFYVGLGTNTPEADIHVAKSFAPTGMRLHWRTFSPISYVNFAEFYFGTGAGSKSASMGFRPFGSGLGNLTDLSGFVFRDGSDNEVFKVDHVNRRVHVGYNIAYGTSTLNVGGNVLIGSGIQYSTYPVASNGLTVQGDAVFMSGLGVQGSSLTVNGKDVCLEDGTNCPPGGGGGSSIYSATSTAFFPFGSSVSTLTITSLNCTGNTNSGKLTTDASGNVVCGDDISGSGGSGTTISVEEGGSSVVASSSITFNAAQFNVTSVSGKGSVVIDTNTAGGIMALSTGTNSAGQLVRLDASADIPDANLSANVSLLGSQIDISGETNLTVEAPILLVGDDVRIDKSSATLLGPTITLGTETDGIYVASLTATSPITLAGTNNVESATPIISLTQNVGTDITADLEEETHASEHQDGGADEISVTGLSGLLADRQKIQISTGGTEVAISSGINFIAGTNVTLSGAYSSANGRVDITINSSGGGGGGSSTLAVGTGTAANFTTNVTSPTAVISFLGDQFKSVANGTTNFITLNLASVTAQGTILAGSNITLTPGAGTLTIAASGSGSGLIVSSFSANYLPLQIILSTGTLGVLNSTSTRPMALFDSSTAEWADWQSIQFSTFATVGSTLKADIAFSMASATSGGVTWGVQLEAITSGDSADFDTNSFDTLNSTSGVPVPATAGYFKVVTIPLTNVDSLAAGDSYRPRLWRLPADSGDTASGDAEFRWMRIYE